MTSLRAMMGEAIDNIKDSIRLDPPDKDIMDKVENKLKSFEQMSTNTSVVTHCVSMCYGWMTKVKEIFAT